MGRTLCCECRPIWKTLGVFLFVRLSVCRNLFLLLVLVDERLVEVPLLEAVVHRGIQQYSLLRPVFDAFQFPRTPVLDGDVAADSFLFRRLMRFGWCRCFSMGYVGDEPCPTVGFFLRERLGVHVGGRLD